MVLGETIVEQAGFILKAMEKQRNNEPIACSTADSKVAWLR
jgi:hypothetical protein